MRQDLKSWSQIAVMAAHASWEARSLSDDNILEHPHLVLLEANSTNEPSLKEIRSYLQDSGVAFVNFHESYYEDPLVAIATEPILEDRRHLFQNFKLLKENCYERNSQV